MRYTSMRNTFFLHFSIFAVLSALVTTILLASVMNRQAVVQMENQVRQEGAYLALALEQGLPAAFLREASIVLPENRITLIEADGAVLYDDKADPAHMENHLDRQEVREALRFGNGASHRFSATTGFDTFYYAQKLSDGRILRTAVTTSLTKAAYMDILPWFALIVCVEIGLCLFLASYQTKRIVGRLNRINLDEPLSYPAYDELAPMLVRMNDQKRQISLQIDMLQRQQKEFAEITEHMREGLMVLGRDGQVLTINHSAALLFGIEADFARGRNLLTIHRSPLLQQATSMAYDGQGGECNLSINGRDYQVLANPVWDGQNVKGAVLLLFDATEKRRAEAMRREFTANVSHELKTPLTTIQGYGELLLRGLTKEKDKMDFIQRIYDESSRMIALVENTMKLSRLDEWNMAEADMPGEIGEASPQDMGQLVDLRATAMAIADRLREKAAAHKVEITVTGPACPVLGNAMLLEELLANLCDNAIKYNTPGGKVEISLASTDEQAMLHVADTGIGIDPTHLDRVFERFYRADHSRARNPEGNGLGLAIVKHIAQLHGGAVQIDSREGQGTTVTVTIPKNAK